MKNKIMALVLVAAVLAFGSVAFAETDQISVKAISADTLNKFRQQTVDLREQLKAKDLELRGLYAFDGIDMRRVDELEGDIKEIKTKIKSVAVTMNLEPCCCL
ncbi:hypothetical protein KI809_02100 [Geobacter pelophilus]|uniref:Uncharacterized protein n=1 Tax=Geoanaerobacter pelophilus TaxID=60036 RepID=A0AAW4L0S0_9BACT|nr:hypothetical protein [Geoanaerobacter pelophilus]MBT0663080.1 hypothetical protein [Geoanaerobacter pelophilus]